MKQWLTMFVITTLLGAPAFGQAAPAPIASRHAVGTLRLQITQFESPLSSSAITPETALSANSTLGFGLIRARPKIPDGRLYGRGPGSRSAGVRFRIRF